MVSCGAGLSGETGVRFLSVCSGIEAASVAWKPLGWSPVAFAEIEAFPSAVLRHHHPETPNWGDMTKFAEWPDATIDLLVGGTPCQSFSVAGLRKGLADPRGNLALTFLAIAAKYAPRWILWENVSGVLSSEQGRDFGAFLGGLGQCGYGWAYRVLDAQHFGIPQRRRRVFVVGHLGDWRRAAAVLFERHSLQGNPPPRREKGPSVAALTANGVGTCGADDNQGQAGHLIPQGYGGETAPTLNAAFGSKLGLDNQHIDSGAGLFIAFTAKDYGADASDISPTLRSGSHSGSHANGGVMPAVAFDTTQITSAANYSNPKPGDPCHPLAAGAHPPAIAGSAVRRLTPRECERLQGFPDDYTLVPYRGKPAADGPRYKALGNSMAVPVMRWIGERIAIVDTHRMAETGTGSGRSLSSDGAEGNRPNLRAA
jgi:DNA (cytosine-5)-methyltransferase 1